METDTTGKKSVDVETDVGTDVVKEQRKIRFDNTLSLGAVMLKGSGLRAGETVTVSTEKGSGLIVIKRVRAERKVRMRRIADAQMRKVEGVKE